MCLLSECFPWDLFEEWISAAEADYWKERLINDIDWLQPKVRIFGSTYIVPRKTCFLAEEGISYKYSGFKHVACGWPDWFLPLLDRVNCSFENSFNGCLINLYRNGSDRMGWHSDDEPELDLNNSIASLSLGESRHFVLKNRRDSTRQRLLLKNGDMLLMHPLCQHEWLHSLPPRKRVKGLRINLTFRRYK